jgi:hypothetical protein
VRAGQTVTKRELEVVAAWWHEGTVVGAAKLLDMHPQTAKNLLHTARMRSGTSTTLALARMHAGDLPSVAALRRRTKERTQRKAS